MGDLIVGIDLGTTFSAVAYVDDEGRPRIIPNAEGEPITPSVVLIEDGRIVVGELALNQAAMKPDNVVRRIKRAMGDSNYRFQGMTAPEISAEILKKLKADAAQALGRNVDSAVITCPAYFSSPEVEATKLAGTLAGLDVPEIVKEPTAAAVYYGVDHLQEGQRLLVCDLGGGTFDATILVFENGTFTPIATTGDRRLGGHDWTTELVKHVCREFTSRYQEDPRTDPIVEHGIYEACERAKRELSRLEEAIVPCVYAGRAEEMRVTRAEFEEQTEWLVTRMLTWVRSTLLKPKPPLTWDGIHGILLVGGATRMRRVQGALQQVSGMGPIITGEADTAVALGAAILAKGQVLPRSAKSALVAGRRDYGIVAVKFDRTASRTLGTKVVSWAEGQPVIQNSPVIPYGTRLPAEETRSDYQISVTGQESFDVPVVEFDDLGPEVILGTYRFTCRRHIPAGTPISVTFAYDGSGIAQVTAVDLVSGQTLQSECRRVDLSELLVHPAPTVVDILFMFDTTGSMYSYLGTVRTNLLSIVREIHQGLPEARLAILAYGDHCDEATAYLVESCDFTTDTRRLLAFITQVGPTDGGDAPEAIEDALWTANRMSWSDVSAKALVLIGDAPSHSASECPHRRDVATEAKHLVDRQIRAYTVLCGDYPGARAQFQWLADLTGGKLLPLGSIQDLSDLLVAIAMREGGKLDSYRSKLLTEKRLTDSKTALFQILDG